MGRKPVFTDKDVIDGAKSLESKKQTINGTNLRLEIGAGSPKKLMETYLNLVSIGRIKSQANSEIVNLEIQLEAQLETLSIMEEKVSELEEENKDWFVMTFNLLSLIPIDVDYEATLLEHLEKFESGNTLITMFYRTCKRNMELKASYKELKIKEQSLVDNHDELIKHFRSGEGMEADLDELVRELEYLKVEISKVKAEIVAK